MTQIQNDPQRRHPDRARPGYGLLANAKPVPECKEVGDEPGEKIVEPPVQVHVEDDREAEKLDAVRVARHGAHRISQGHRQQHDVRPHQHTLSPVRGHHGHQGRQRDMRHEIRRERPVELQKLPNRIGRIEEVPGHQRCVVDVRRPIAGRQMRKRNDRQQAGDNGRGEQHVRTNTHQGSGARPASTGTAPTRRDGPRRPAPRRPTDDRPATAAVHQEPDGRRARRRIP